MYYHYNEIYETDSDTGKALSGFLRLNRKYGK